MKKGEFPAAPAGMADPKRDLRNVLTLLDAIIRRKEQDQKKAEDQSVTIVPTSRGLPTAAKGRLKAFGNWCWPCWANSTRTANPPG